MNNSIPYYEPEDWGWFIQPTIISAVIARQKELRFLFWWFDKYARSETDKITSWKIFRELRLEMPRKKGSNGTASNNGGNSNSGEGKRNEWKWANVKFSDEDLDVLAASDQTLEFLSACICALANDGIGVTIKPVDAGKSVCCTLYRPDYPGDGVTLGVSAFGGNVRDALLSVLYKLDNYGGGDFTGFDIEVSSETPKSRFR